MEEKIFEDIIDDKLGLFWAGNEYYPAETLTDNDKNKLNYIHCKRYLFEGVNSQENSTIIDDFLTEFGNIVFNDYSNIYQIYIEHSAKTPNKVRSYKGFLSKKENDINTFIEIEVSNEKKTIIGGIINLTQENYKNNIELIWDRNTSFILCSKKKLFTKEFISFIIDNYRNKGTNTDINYLKLITDFCFEGDKIYKVGGGVSDTFFTIDCFFNFSL